MEQDGRPDPERPTPDDPHSDRRQSRRLSLVKAKEMVGAAIGAVVKIAEPKKEVDPEDEPDFTERHPQWEDELPPIYPHEDHVPDLLTLEDAAAAPQVPIAPKVRPPKLEEPHLSQSALRARERWKLAYSTIKKNLALRNQALRSSIGTGGELEGFSFGVWHRYSPSRISLFQSIYNKKTEYVIFCLIILHVVIMILKASKKGSWKNAKITMDQLNIIDAVLTFIFSVECIARIACLGLYKGPKTYLRNSYNKLDLVSVLDSWAHLIATRFFKKLTFFRFLVLRLFRALLTLRDIEFFSQVLVLEEI